MAWNVREVQAGDFVRFTRSFTSKLGIGRVVCLSPMGPGCKLDETRIQIAWCFQDDDFVRAPAELQAVEFFARIPNTPQRLVISDMYDPIYADYIVDRIRVEALSPLRRLSGNSAPKDVFTLVGKFDGIQDKFTPLDEREGSKINIEQRRLWLHSPVISLPPPPRLDASPMHSPPRRVGTGSALASLASQLVQSQRSTPAKSPGITRPLAASPGIVSLAEAQRVTPVLGAGASKRVHGGFTSADAPQRFSPPPPLPRLLPGAPRSTGFDGPRIGLSVRGTMRKRALPSDAPARAGEQAKRARYM